MIFTPNQIEELMGILEKYTLTFVAKHVGTDILSKQDRDLLRMAGVDIAKINANASNIAQSFKFGMLSDALGSSGAKGMTYEGFKKLLNTGKFIPLNRKEEGALTSLKYQTYTDMKGLTSKMQTDVRQKLVMADKVNNEVKHSPKVTEAAKRAIEHRKGVTFMASELGHMTGKWGKDLGRISDFVMHTAFDEGRAMGFERRDGENALVYKDVYPGACKHCVKHYLDGGIGSAPKVFKLADLKANGTNVGRKAAEYQPVIGPLHPWCRCTLERVPFGFTIADYKKGLWEWNGSMFVRAESEGTPEPKVKRRKVKIKVNGKESYV
jgi:hypothetical protein